MPILAGRSDDSVITLNTYIESAALQALVGDTWYLQMSQQHSSFSGQTTMSSDCSSWGTISLTFDVPKEAVSGIGR